MDFKSIKQKAIKFKNDAISSGAKKLAESSMVIKTKEDLEKIIYKSKNTSFTNKDTGETKEFNKHSIVIFAWKNTDFYKNSLISFPVLMTKSWSQGVAFKMSDLDLKELKKYKISEFPSLVLFSNEKLNKIIVWEENIKNIVKKLDLDIIKAIDNL